MGQWQLVSPVVILALSSIFVLLAGLWVSNQGFLLAASVLSLLGAGAAALYVSGAEARELFTGLLVYDTFSQFITLFSIATVLITVLFASQTKELLPKRRFEFYSILLTLACGLIFMGSANHFLMIYLGIETVSLLSYSLAGFSKERVGSNEASTKYVVYGSMASAIMVYGMSLIYGVTGTLEVGELQAYLSNTPEVPGLLWVAMIFVLAGMGFKISAAPMHMWTPDVYEGAPTPVSALLSVAPKAAGLAVLMRFLVVGFSSVAGPLEPQMKFSFSGPIDWPFLILISSAITMFSGNLAALAQQSVKRILAYSSIAHAGYMMMGLTPQSSEGLSSILFYLVVYCFMNMGAFWVASKVEEAYGGDRLVDFRGLGRRQPLFAVVMTIFMCSLVGIPPFAGFVGKYLLFSAVINEGLYTFAVIAAVNSVISLYYYMKVVKAMFLEAPVGDDARDLSAFRGWATPAALLALALPNILLGFWGPGIEMVADWSYSALNFFVRGP